MLLDVDRLEDESLVALDDVPWIATEESDAIAAGIVGRVPAAEAIIRAALATDATVLEARAGDLGGDPVAALLRWPADVPATA